MFDGCQRCGRTLDEKRRGADAHARKANLFFEFGSNVDDVAEAGC